jgi:hypothetical protein
VNALGLEAAHGAGEHVKEVRAVDREIGIAVALDRDGSEVEELPGLARVPQADLLAGRLAGQRLQLLADAERVERARAVRAELQSGADFLQLGSLLVDLDVAALAQGGQGSGEPTDARAYDEDFDLAIP